MQWTTRFSKAQYQTTGRVFIFWIIFDPFTVPGGLPNFNIADIAFDCPPQGMTGEFEFAVR